MKKSPRSARPPRPAKPPAEGASRALAVTHEATPLASDPEALFAEALRLGRESVEAAESLLATYGQWLFANLFAGDARRVLDRAPEHPVWVRLFEHANSASFRLSKRSLSTTLRVAAYDKRLADSSWERLSYSHKDALLPLADPRALRSAARHVLASSLSVRETSVYVESLRGPVASPPRLSPVMARRAVSRLAAPFAKARYTERLAGQLNKLAASDRAEARRELGEVVEKLQALLASIEAD